MVVHQEESQQESQHDSQHSILYGEGATTVDIENVNGGGVRWRSARVRTVDMAFVKQECMSKSIVQRCVMTYSRFG